MAKTSGSFKKGDTNNKGKPKGAKNHITKTVKETVLAAFIDLQKDPKANILMWGKSNPKDFYIIAAKLIPTEVNAKVEQVSIKVIRE
jgi:hypothetical protein